MRATPTPLVVAPVTSPTPRRIGRPRKLALPPMPQEVFAGMSALEVEHFDFFVAAFMRDYPGMTPTDQLCLQQAALEYVNLLRVQAEQIRTGHVISMARQHPGVQLRAWLDMMSVTRKTRLKEGDKKDEKALADLLAQLSA